MNSVLKKHIHRISVPKSIAFVYRTQKTKFIKGFEKILFDNIL